MRIGDYILANLPEDQYVGQSNEEVVKHYRNRECSFDQVLLRYHYYICQRSTTKMPGMEGDDLYQELAAKLFRCCDTWDENSGNKFITYVDTAVTNHIRKILREQLNLTRRINYEIMVSLSDMGEDADGAPYINNEPLVEDDHGLTEFTTGLHLSPRESECIRLLLSGKTKTEIGLELGLNRASIGNIFKRIGNRAEAARVSRHGTP